MVALLEGAEELISACVCQTDLQMVNISLRVLHKPNVSFLPKIFQRLGIDYDERVLPSIGNEVLKAVVAQYNAVQLLTHREQVSNQLRKILSERAEDFHIELEDVAITHLSFGQEFARAIEQKQVAEQEAERAKFVVQKSEQERQAAIIRAEGESAAAKLISDATQKAGPGLVELRRIEAAKEITSSLARQRNVVYMPQSAIMLMQMPPQ